MKVKDIGKLNLALKLLQNQSMSGDTTQRNLAANIANLIIWSIAEEDKHLLQVKEL